jgi:hypothetical protein
MRYGIKQCDTVSTYMIRPYNFFNKSFVCTKLNKLTSLELFPARHDVDVFQKDHKLRPLHGSSEKKTHSNIQLFQGTQCMQGLWRSGYNEMVARSYETVLQPLLLLILGTVTGCYLLGGPVRPPRGPPLPRPRPRPIRAPPAPRGPPRPPPRPPRPMARTFFGPSSMSKFSRGSVSGRI